MLADARCEPLCGVTTRGHCTEVTRYLHKRGSARSMVGRRNWKRRWFVLEEGLLEYHKSKSSARPGAAPRGQLNVYGATVHTCCVVPLVFHPSPCSPPPCPHPPPSRMPCRSCPCPRWQRMLHLCGSAQAATTTALAPMMPPLPHMCPSCCFERQRVLS